jgi:hypothetical protein
VVEKRLQVKHIVDGRRRKLIPHEARRRRHCGQFPERGVARQVFHSAVRRSDDTLRADAGKRSADAAGDDLRRLEFACGEVMPK